jgi:hypothetical protein
MIYATRTFSAIQRALADRFWRSFEKARMANMGARPSGLKLADSGTAALGDRHVEADIRAYTASWQLSTP